MKRLFTTLIILVLVGFAAFKAGVWWLADQRMADARQALEEFGVLHRGSISSGVDGRVVLNGASWQDFELTQPLDIARAEFDAGSPVNLLTGLADPSSLPAQWSLRLDGVSLRLDPTMLRNWVTADGANSEGEQALFVLSCAPDPRQQLGSGDLIRMGIAGLAGDAFLRQDPGRIHAELNTISTGSLELDWPAARVRYQDGDVTISGGTEPLQLTLRDAGLMRRIAAYCAREAGIEPDKWAKRSLDALIAGLEAQGLAPSDQLKALYRQWLLEGGELTVSLQPGEALLGIPVRAEGAGQVSSSWPVRYNGAGVPDVYLTEAKPVIPETPDIAVEPVVPRENPGVEGWYVADMANADQWIDHRVRVTLSNDNVVEGRLVSVSERELEVARVVAGGEVAYPMLIRAITNFEVWRRGRAQ
ncbi:acetylornithine deacetylase [Marinobacter guineae]|uniref:Acetylornithine deacetylase n=1 Tax=Marinobacter guineae TaxID=432303 RepID=A0A2G1VEW0_9GAMM|nr:acetylornithine deacetylase [Marinobacter guineae]PHQ25317.1 acetylornithine deacetylase [Marinobacter guineae]